MPYCLTWWPRSSLMFRNQVERAFGVMKKRFKILVTGIEGLNLSETWDTIYCCVAIHNFIRSHVSDVNTDCDIQRHGEHEDEAIVNEEILQELDLNAVRQARDLQDEAPLDLQPLNLPITMLPLLMLLSGETPSQDRCGMIINMN